VIILLRKIVVPIILLAMLLITSVTEAITEEEFAKAREKMVLEQLKGRDITDPKVLEVMGKVLRHKFVSEDLLRQAYADHPLPIGEGQTISQPYIVALMTQVLKLEPSDKALEVGTGSGYQAAVLAEIVDQVYTVEIRPKLAESAAERLKELEYDNIEVRSSDGYFGWEENAPFDAIIVTCAADHIPPPLISQLRDGGMIVIPVGSPFSYQQLILLEKKGSDIYTKQITGVLFVPMIGEIEKRGK